jgi:hypothetical protein
MAMRPIGLLIDAMIDHKAAAPPLAEKGSWVLPGILGGALTLYLAFEIMPFTLEAVRNSVPSGSEPRQVEDMMATFHKYQFIGAVLSPALLLGKWIITAAILYVGCVLFEIRASMRNLFAIASHCGFILICQDILTLVVLRLRGGAIQSSADLMVSFGPDLFYRPEGSLTLAALSFLSLFNLWYYTSLALLMSFMGGASRSSGFMAAAPLAALHFLFVLGISLLQ